jgi:MoxR-like ATPase
MQERTVTIDRKTHELSSNFTVFATQNPIEYEGTYPLPEAQKDRFMLKITMDHPGRNEELALAARMLGKDSPENVLAGGLVKQVLTPEILTKLRESLEEILVKEELSAYIVDIVRQTRNHPSILVGAGPRATQSLILAARTHAAINGRDFITPDDIKTLALPVLEHRLILRPEFEIEGLTVNEVIEEILKEIAVPR